MDGQSDCYVAGALSSMLQISRLAGLAPLKFTKKGSGWLISPSSPWAYYGYFIATAIVVTTIASLITDLQLSQEQSVRVDISTRRVVWIADVFCMLVIAATSVYGAPQQMRVLIACINRIEKINIELNFRRLPLYSERKKTRLIFFWVTVTVVLTVLDYLMLLGDIEMDKIQIWVSLMYSFYYCCHWILQLRELSFLMTTLHFIYCFRRINASLINILRELSEGNEMPLVNGCFTNFNKKNLFTIKVNDIAGDVTKIHPGIQKTKNHQDMIRRLALAYADTCCVVRFMDNANGLILLMMLASFLLHLVCTPYYLINCLFDHSEEEDATAHGIYVGVQTVWCFYYAVNLLLIIEPCHLTQMEMETTCELVSCLMRCTYSTHDPLALELDTFFKYLSLNRVSYSAMHVTTISRSLVASILGSVTTYLVVIIQL